MKKYGWIILLIVSLIIGGIIYFYTSNTNEKSNYSAEKTIRNDANNTISNTIENNTSIIKHQTTIETEIATYSTKIQNKRDSNRQGNITITCSALNNTAVAPGETFSFCDTVGKSTEDRGYKEANVIIQGIETKGLGGGNCQVSSTLYNAVLAAPNDLEVVERHPHSAPVPYIEEGKDAAVSYRFS